MGDLFVVNVGHDDDDEWSRQEAERVRLRDRYLRHLVDSAGIDELTGERVIAALFDHVDSEGRRCVCGCHPRLAAAHDDGFDCPCTWDDTRRAEEWRRRVALWDTPAASGLRDQHAAQEQAIADWLAGQPGVDARRITSFAPEQWKGTVDGRSFYFRERGGLWRIELDLQPTGGFANRVVDVGEDGELVTEPVPVMEGEVIAEGVDSQLGDAPVERIAFIVTTIRDHLWARGCDHSGALFFCPKCGRRMSGPA